MTIRSVVAACLGLPLALALAPVPPAGAATLSFTDANCADFAITDVGGGNFQVTCNFVVVPVCQLSASTTSPSIGSTITLSAACSGKPFGWLFSGNSGNCSTSSSACTDTQSTAGPVTYTVVAGNAAGRGPASTITVNWQAGAPLTAPSGCTLSASPASLPTGGGATTLSVSCAGGGAPTSFAWTGGSLTASTATGSQSTNVTTTTAFSVTPSNSAGVGNTASATVTVAGTTTTALDFCGQYTNVVILDVPFGGQATSGGSGGSFAAKGILVARFTVPANFTSTSGSKATITLGEYGDPATYRQASLSPKACDFRGVANTYPGNYTSSISGGGASWPLVWSASNGPSVQFTVNGTAIGTPQLVPGQTYYWNIRNYSPYLNGGAGGVSCSGATCNVVVQIPRPL